MSAIRLAIVIVNWNGGRLLTRCLESIHTNHCDADMEVIVIDNHSTDGSREAAAAAFPGVRVIDSGSNLGFGRANNLAATLTDSPIILFLNPDTELMKDTLAQALRCLDRHPEVGALGCRMIYSDGRVQNLGLQWHATPWTILFELLFITERSWRYFRRWLPIVDPNRSCQVMKLYGGFMMVRRATLDTVGWFDERYFMYGEDADLSRAILDSGWQLYYCSEASIIHKTGGVTVHAPAAFAVLMKQESINKFIAKHYGRHSAILHRLVVLLGGSVRLLAVLLSEAAATLSNTRPSPDWRGASREKQQQLLLWSLGLKKATIPVGPSRERA